MSDNEIKIQQKELIAAKRREIANLQMTIKEAGLPVIVLVEGFGTSGKGTLIGNIIREMDPRFFRVISEKYSKESDRYPFLWKYFNNIPEKGKFIFMDSGWLGEVVSDMLIRNVSDKHIKQKIKSINTFERQLRDNGYVVVKIFLDITKKEQGKRIEKLMEGKDTAWRVNKLDMAQYDEHEEFEKAFKSCMKKMSTPDLPWQVVDAKDEKSALIEAFDLITTKINEAVYERNEETAVAADPLADEEGAEEIHQEIAENTGAEYADDLLHMPLLADVPLNQTMTQEEYEKELDKCRKKLAKLHNKLYRAKIPVVIAYEGWDAAGKGGNIKRLVSGFDARGCEVHPIASPIPAEKNRHYLWRFWTRLPKDGHIAVFDRTWYGRVMVERLEGFCSEADWKRAYKEINEFEKELSDWGAIVVKFWVQIDKDTQLKRFNERQNTPEKQWKITDEDWRNREKWDAYEDAINEMLQKTSTKIAPWHIIESNNKYYARIKAMHTVIDAIEERLGE